LCEQWRAQQWVGTECATEAYTAALSKRPESGWLRGRVGDFYRSLAPDHPDAWGNAEDNYRRAMQQRPCDPWAHARLAYVLAARPQPDPAGAITQYQLALQLVHAETAPNTLADLEHNLQILQATHKTSDPSPTISVLCQPLVLQ